MESAQIGTGIESLHREPPEGCGVPNPADVFLFFYIERIAAMASEERFPRFSPVVDSTQTLSRGYIVPPAVNRKEEREFPVEEHESRLRGTECILMVDDEPCLRDVAEYVLSKLGYKVILATDGESALQLYREGKDDISLIVLDLIMPGMGGRRCLEQFLNMNPDARIIVVSGYTDEQPPEGFLGIGAREFVTKPYDMKDLTRVIRTVLDGRS